VRRPTSRRRGGALPATVGFLGVGVSAMLLNLIGARVLSPGAFSGVVVAWTVSNVFGLGVGNPTEQLISRRLNVQADDPVRGPLRRLVIAALVAAALTLALTSNAISGRGYPLLAPTAILAIAGWVAVVVVRGRLAGRGDLVAYSGVLLVEAVLRVGLLGAGALFPGSADVLLGASVPLPLLAAAAMGAVFVVPRVADRQVERTAGGEPGLPVGEQLGFMAVSVGYQVCLQSAVLLLGWQIGAGREAAVGAFGSVNSYFRTPTVLIGGIVTHALVALSHAWGTRDRSAFSAALRRPIRGVAVVGLGGTVLVGLAAPVLLPIYYPHPLGLPLHLLVALAVSTVLATFGSLMIVPLLAAGRSRTAAAAWLGGGIVTVLVLVGSSGTDALESVGVMVGPLTALAVAGWGVRSLLRAAWRGEEAVGASVARPTSTTPPLG
jgi:O-antigen/teichoic acid export membrane protein